VSALYERVGKSTYRSTPLTAGPWSPEAQHGGPVAALLAHVMQEAGTPGMFPARFTTEFLRPVPIDTLKASAAVLRTGRRVEIVTASLTADGLPVATARQLRIRRHPGLDVPEYTTEAPPAIPDEGGLGVSWDYVGFITDALDVRFVEGTLTEAGPAKAWIRLDVNVVDDVPPLPSQRVLVAADCGNGISSVAHWRHLLYINPDLTVHLHREPAGKWVFMDSQTVLEDHGVGLAQSVLSDERGTLGRSLQSLYVAGV
jgi:hypothetical protein